MDHLTSSLHIALSQYSDKGIKIENQDTLGARIPVGSILVSKGIALAIADGVSSSQSAKQASQTAVTAFLTDYYATPDSWSTEHSAKTVIQSLNRYLWGQSRNSVREEGQLTTFTALILKGESAFIFHVGDTRTYRYRDGVLEQLTTDHTQRLDKNTSYLSRALGADLVLEIEYIVTDLRPGDIFIQSSDGIHDAILSSDLQQCIVFHQPNISHQEPVCSPAAEKANQRTDEQRALSEKNSVDENDTASNLTESILSDIVQTAINHQSDDNLSLQVVHIEQTGKSSKQEAIQSLTQLPFPPFLSQGQTIDGYTIEKILHESERSQIYLVRNAEGKRLAMKTPSVNYEDDPAYIERFIMESWIGARIQNSHVVRIHTNSHERKYLYYLTEYIAGPNLTQVINERAPMAIQDAVELLEILIKATRAFHRKDTLHQDIKPDNIIVGKNGPILIDFGSCWVAGVQEVAAPFQRDKILGTLEYSAPEYRCGGAINQRADQFSLAVILYEMLTAKKPYGEQYENAMQLKEFQKLQYSPAAKYNPLIPYWIDKSIEKALSLDPQARYSALSEWLQDLKRPNQKWETPQQLPLAYRDPLLFWKILAGIGWGCFVTSLYFAMKK